MPPPLRLHSSDPIKGVWWDTGKTPLLNFIESQNGGHISGFAVRSGGESGVQRTPLNPSTNVNVVPEINEFLLSSWGIIITYELIHSRDWGAI